MRRFEAATIIRALLTTDQYKVKDSLTDEQLEAIQMAYWALRNPENLCCGFCAKFEIGEEDKTGWCLYHDRAADSSDSACHYFETGGLRYEK